jgi:acetyltransferase
MDKRMLLSATSLFDPSHDVYRYEPRALDAIFKPKNVAVIGATETAGSVGRTVLWNLISNPFGGTVFPVNPKRAGVLGIKAYPTIKDVPEKIDLAVVVTPPQTVPGIIKDCVDLGVPGAIIITAGFKEIGPEGAALEQKILEIARGGNLRIIGPNCLGVMSTVSGLNATFAAGMARAGNVGFISQSGALCTAILDWSFEENVGFSHFISIGSMLDVDWGDLIYYLGDDPHTQSIVIYMETIGNARSFLSAAREVAQVKPIIIIKPGRTEGAAKAAASHTGSLTGSDEVLDVAFKRSGVLRVNSIGDLFAMAEVLAKQPRPQGPRLTIVTNAGGPGVLATDALLTSGGELTPLSEETMQAFNEFLPPVWSHNNPVDIIGDATPERYAKALETAAKDPNSDGILVILTPQAMTDPTATAEKLRPYATSTGKPVLASWMGGKEVAAGIAILNRASIPSFEYPDDAVRMFSYMWQYSQNLRSLYETPTLSPHWRGNGAASSFEEGEKILAQVRASGRTILTEFESKQLLAAYHIPTVETRIATDSEQAIAHARDLGYPVVLKLYSETITHKTDVGGVILNLKDADAVKQAFDAIKKSVSEKVGAKHFQGVTVQPMIKLDGYELILGSSVDPQFGPVLLFGSGGQLVEVFKDSALGLPPLTSTLARRMIEQTKIYKALKGVRGRKPVDLAALETLMVQFSQLVAEHRWIKEIDINPLLASPERLIALDARVVLHDPNTPEEALPQLAIRPYPTQYIKVVQGKDGVPLTLRPIRPEDEPLISKFHETLSDRSVYLRYFSPLVLSQRVTHERLARVCFADYNREIPIVVEREGQIIAVSRLSRLHQPDTARFTMLVSDRFQGQGLGHIIMQHILEIARAEKLTRLVAHMLAENTTMQRLCQKHGFHITPLEQGFVRAEITL